MTDRAVKIPGPDHPITITASSAHVTVRADGHMVAQTNAALTLKEASYPPVVYIPRDDAKMALLTRSDHTTYCPYKGECSYFHLPHAPNAVWSYEQPYEAVAAIKDHLAFYLSRAAVEQHG